METNKNSNTRTTLLVLIVSLFALSVAAPADAVEKCRAKMNKRTGEISYSFKYITGPVQFAYADYGLPSTHTDEDLYSFSNEDSCQTSGKGKSCVVSDNADAAASAPPGCKTYLYDAADDTTCVTRVPYCQSAKRLLPTKGYYAVKNNQQTTAVWDAATGIQWNISPDHQERSLDEHYTHLADLNGTHVDPADTDHVPLVDSGELKLPTLHQVKRLAQDCVDLFNEIGGIAGTPSSSQLALHTLCTEAWLDPISGVPGYTWLRTKDATQPTTHALAFCLSTSASGFTMDVISQDMLQQSHTALWMINLGDEEPIWQAGQFITETGF
jgi:hypothetical protein